MFTQSGTKLANQTTIYHLNTVKILVRCWHERKTIGIAFFFSTYIERFIRVAYKQMKKYLVQIHETDAYTNMMDDK